MASLLEKFRRYEACFYRSSSGAEIDLVLEKGRTKIAIEIKSSSAPSLTQGYFEALKVIQPERALVLAPVDTPYPLKNDVWVHSLESVLAMEF